ncbi:hypothetical protein F4V43_07490 [Paenibacillus spiritus]|uniref:Uncharacterized protein n=1 Tax=Paenibacillus spiritus TaxID=2496557 RepID=A0A5J5GCM5_9BACL|nr:hypothetical protein [Paenibacillus spiritus]KAA9005905.1 hypothetical protein F4V43_07490 [Paenibacillus spiritus]
MKKKPRQEMARLTEQEDDLLQKVEATQYLLTAIIRHVESERTLDYKSARSVLFEAHRLFAQADRKLMKCRLKQIYFKSHTHDET